jgi:predicted nuclease of restriction endonuclease-like (RecB) superfamily
MTQHPSDPPIAKLLPAGYDDLLRDLKQRIRTARVRAALAVNRELVLLYWSIGRDILQQQAELGWGAKVIEQLAGDLRREFPEMTGLSPRNLKYMRAFAEAWPDEAIVQQVVAQIPWGHNVRLLDYLDAPEERLWYARQTVEYGWSRNVLQHQVESRLYERQGKALTNFDRVLPPPQSDLAHQLLKDPYNFEFLTLQQDAEERVFGVSEYLIMEALPEELKSSLPTIEQLEAELAENDEADTEDVKDRSNGTEQA